MTVFATTGDHHLKKYFYLQAVPSPPTASLLRQAQTLAGPQARVPARRVLQVDRLQRPSGAPHFHAQLTPEPPIFHFAVAYTYQNLGLVPIPPPSANYA